MSSVSLIAIQLKGLAAPGEALKNNLEIILNYRWPHSCSFECLDDRLFGWILVGRGFGWEGHFGGVCRLAMFSIDEV